MSSAPTVDFSIIDTPGQPGRRGDVVDSMLLSTWMELQDFSPATWDRLARIGDQVRSRFGGEGKVYIRKNRTQVQNADIIGRCLREGLSIEAAFRYAGVSRATGYRVIGKRQRAPPER